MKKKIISVIIFMLLISIMHISYGAVEIVLSKDNQGKDAIVNTDVTNSYLLCKGMTGVGESLYGATVLPHLATNADWGAVSYLANSIYGTNTAGTNKGIEIKIDNTGKEVEEGGIKYYSCNGNITGVMNWGINPNKTLYTQTSSLIKAYVDDNSESTANKEVEELYNNKNTRFVEIINTGSFTVPNTRGMALAETSGLHSDISWKSSSTNVNYPIFVRQGLFGFFGGSTGGNNGTSGAGRSDVTFRPVVWNE